MLKMIKDYGIELELLLNTLVLKDEYIKEAKELLDGKNIEIDSVCFLTDYYDSVVKYFPNKKVYLKLHLRYTFFLFNFVFQYNPLNLEV